MTTEERNQRIVDLVTAPGSIVRPSDIVDDHVLIIDGRTGLDACERSADAAFDVLFREMDEGVSPYRIEVIQQANA